MVHGDIKPDNIGKRGPRYILLDFGICRPIADFVADTTATGSLRTRAPELLTADTYLHPERADVWALGATVFNALLGRFPLVDPGEKIPRISTPAERREFETLLASRVEREWDKRIDVSSVPSAIRGLLRDVLEKDPNKRPTAAKLVTTLQTDLAPFLRTTSDDGRFSAIEELQQLTEYLPEEDVLVLMPINERQDLRSRLQRLNASQSLESHHRVQIDKLLQRVG